jgi:hypothetical protein
MHTDVIPLVAIAFVHAAILAVIPIAAIAIGCRIINLAHDARVPWTPAVELVAFATGAVGGAIVFWSDTDAAILGPSAVFAVGGPWDMDIGQFLARVADPLDYDLSVLLSWPGAAVPLVAAAIVLAPILRFRSAAAFANGIRTAFLAASGAWVAIYALGYCLWLANRLNFWVFLVVMIVIEKRGRSHHVVLKLN